MIEKILPSSEARVRVIRSVYETPGIKMTGLIKKAGTSPTIVTKYVNELVKAGVFRENISGVKRTHIRALYPKFSSFGILVFSLIEADKKHAFLAKYSKFRPIITQLEQLLWKSKVEFCLIHGSFARLSADKTSDVDILIVGDLTKNENKALSEILVTLERNYTVDVESIETFIEKSGNPFHQTILRDHVVVWNEYGFVKTFGDLIERI